MEKNGMSFASWLLIIILIAGVGVGIYFLIPKTNYADAFDNMEEIRELLKVESVEEKNIETHTKEIQILCAQNNLNDRSMELSMLCNIIDSLSNADFSIMGALLSVNQDSKEYSSLNNEQNKILENCKDSYTAMLKYIDGPYKEFLKVANPSFSLISEYSDPYIEKLKIFVNDLSLFYITTAELVEKSTKKSIENNELTITAINEISKASLRILNFNNDNINESYNYSLKLLNKSQIYFSNNFYQNYFAQNPTYTIETIKQEISILAPENW